MAGVTSRARLVGHLALLEHFHAVRGSGSQQTLKTTGCAPLADVAGPPFPVFLLDDYNSWEVEQLLTKVIRSIPGMPGAEQDSRDYDSMLHVRVFGSVWRAEGAEIVVQWPPHIGHVPVDLDAENPGLSISINASAPPPCNASQAASSANCTSASVLPAFNVRIPRSL